GGGTGGGRDLDGGGSLDERGVLGTKDLGKGGGGGLVKEGGGGLICLLFRVENEV
ncbi:hypothetical protein TorRG33x02_097140, partial [Trema orientale]